MPSSVPALSPALLGLALLTLACQRPAAYRYLAPPATTSPAAAPATQPRLVFMAFRAAAAPGAAVRFELLETTVVAGSLKADTPPPASADTYLSVAQLDARGQVLHTTSIDHPLRRDAELGAAGGELRRQAVTLPEAEFFVRLPLQAGAATVRLTETIDRQPGAPADFPLSSRP
ncbi:hypothetical protein [Hymenobacter sp. B81]|uniref:hypothetical protein n=1 Tax=Hymenobacter sp. B81 TaxID=3344878 RepID=UPI0037DD8BB0